MKIVQPAATLTLDAARTIARAASDKAAALGCAMNVAVVDGAGHLLCFERNPGAFIESIKIARDKARTAAGFGAPTEKLEELFDKSASLRLGIAGRPGVAAFKGGFPMYVDGHLVAGIGVSGGSSEQDAEVARAGVTALEELVSQHR